MEISGSGREAVIVTPTWSKVLPVVAGQIRVRQVHV